MRPQQQNRRMRGRNNNRKGPNPLTRSYESNGPDVKIRGSAQQIAEKYTTLARDAMSSGDRVIAENYLQHAEHYNRIIAAAQAQMPIQQFSDRGIGDEDEMDDERDEFDPASYAMPQQPAQGGEPRNGGGGDYRDRAEPRGDGRNGQNGENRERADARGDNRNNQGNNGYPRGDRPDRGERFDRGDRPDRNERRERGNERPFDRQPDVTPMMVNHAEAPQPTIEGVPAEVALDGGDLSGQAADAVQSANGAPNEDGARRPRRPRRPRREPDGIDPRSPAALAAAVEQGQSSDDAPSGKLAPAEG